MRAKKQPNLLEDKTFFRGGILYAICQHCGRVRNLEISPICPSQECVSARLEKEGEEYEAKRKEQKAKEAKEQKQEKTRLKHEAKERAKERNRERARMRYWAKKKELKEKPVLI